MGRPKLVIDEKQVYQLAAINCSLEEMGLILKCDPKTLTSRFSSVIKEGRANGCMSLKRKQFDLAMKGNVTMLIWLGKQTLGQRDQPMDASSVAIPAPVYSIAKKLVSEG